MKELKDYLIIILAIIVMALVLLKGCSQPFSNLDVMPQTVYQSDTIFNIDTLVQLKTIYHPKYDTLYKTDTLIEQSKIDSLPFIRIYNDSLKDSALTIFTKAKTFGYLDELKIEYKLKRKPALITNTVTKIEIKYKPSKISIYTGLRLEGNRSSFNLFPFVNINIKQATIQYSYGVLNNSHGIGVGYKIFNSKE